jgi:tetratricopeptide (TPR) repeat protein
VKHSQARYGQPVIVQEAVFREVDTRCRVDWRSSILVSQSLLSDESAHPRRNEPNSLLADGIRYERGGVVNRARECFEAVTRSAEENPEDAAEAWWRLANLHRLHSSWDEALRCARKSAALAHEHGLANTEADALNIEGAVWYVRGDYEQARVHYTRVLDLATTSGTRAKALQNLGTLAAEVSDFDEGERLFAESRAAFRSAGDARGEANSLLNMGRLQLDRGFPDIANRTLDEAVTAARQTGDLEMHAAALLNHGIALGELGRNEEAEERVITAYGQFTIADIPVQRVRSLMQLAALAASRHEAGAARVCLEHAKDVAESAQLPRELAMIAERLSALGEAHPASKK